MRPKKKKKITLLYWSRKCTQVILSTLFFPSFFKFTCHEKYTMCTSSIHICVCILVLRLWLAQHLYVVDASRLDPKHRMCFQSIIWKLICLQFMYFPSPNHPHTEAPSSTLNSVLEYPIFVAPHPNLYYMCSKNTSTPSFLVAIAMYVCLYVALF